MAYLTAKHTRLGDGDQNRERIIAPICWQCPSKIGIPSDVWTEYSFKYRHLQTLAINVWTPSDRTLGKTALWVVSHYNSNRAKEINKQFIHSFIIHLKEYSVQKLAFKHRHQCLNISGGRSPRWVFFRLPRRSQIGKLYAPTKIEEKDGGTKRRKKSFI